VYSYKESDFALTDWSLGSCISTPDCWLEVNRHPEGPATGQHDQECVNVKMAVPEAWMFVCCECYVLSGRGLCDELITRPEEFFRMWCVVVCDLETSRMRMPRPFRGCRAKNKNKTKLVVDIVTTEL
jgi:hypothetical protein